ncbi:hypothetical protein BC827DRAFT_765219 [Russula dissimulans]|nr:hypothetical protein BC827DRAFT_765219 [Russula dissimulans]
MHVMSGGLHRGRQTLRTHDPLATMRPFVQPLVRALRHTRYNNPSFIPAATRHLASTRPAYKSSPRSRPASAVSDDDHSAESYLKEVDSSPPADSSTYQVDASSDKVQRPHHPPSGAYSQAGVGSEEYRAVDKQAAAYDPPSGSGSGSRGGPGAEAGKKLRYGGKASHPGEGPDGAGRATGRKPEGK